jgi:hypothetical protein
MCTLRSASYALGVLAFAGICAICAIGSVKSALAAGPRLLYVSDPTVSNIAVFSLPDLVIKGTITGLNQPDGLCSDDGGNVWVTNFGTQQILEYAHGGTSPIATLTDSSGFPFACDVEHHRHGHHDLAVANLHNAPSGPGETEKYPDSTGPPLPSYDLAAMYTVRGEGYDPHGNLFIDGQTHTGAFVLAELTAGSTAVHQLTFTGGTIHLPGMLQWYADGNYLAVGDRRCDTPRTTCVYHVKISGSTGTITGKTKFKAYNGHVICDMAQGAIGASGEKFLAGGDDESACGYATSSVNRWVYPSGGLPTNSNHSTLTHPFGTAISP